MSDTETNTVTYQGKQMTIGQLAKLTGVNKTALWRRIIHKKMTAEAAVSAKTLTKSQAGRRAAKASLWRRLPAVLPKSNGGIA